MKPETIPDEIHTASEDQSDSPNQTGSSDQAAPMPAQIGGRQKAIHQGDIYWVPLDEANGLEPGITHPHVVIQDDVLNRSRIHTVAVCALTTNMKRAKAPGNVLLEAGEANLPKQSIVVVSQVSSVDKAQLGEYIGTLSQARINQILAGMRFLQLMTEARNSDREEE
jgi:mRNA interferase MazF